MLVRSGSEQALVGDHQDILVRAAVGDGNSTAVGDVVEKLGTRLNVNQTPDGTDAYAPTGSMWTLTE